MSGVGDVGNRGKNVENNNCPSKTLTVEVMRTKNAVKG